MDGFHTLLNGVGNTAHAVMFYSPRLRILLFKADEKLYWEAFLAVSKKSSSESR
jgi:hypothetical protein